MVYTAGSSNALDLLKGLLSKNRHCAWVPDNIMDSKIYLEESYGISPKLGSMITKCVACIMHV